MCYCIKTANATLMYEFDSYIKWNISYYVPPITSISIDNFSCHSQLCKCPDWVRVIKLFQPLEDGSISRGDRLGTGPWWFQSAGIQPVRLAHRASALHCICGQMPWHLDPGIVSDHQHVLALRETLWDGQYAGPGALSGADCWPWWSLISIIHYPRPADKSGSHRSLPLNCTLSKRCRGHMWGSVVPGQQGRCCKQK